MASAIAEPVPPAADAARAPAPKPHPAAPGAVLRWLASLRLTVVLFALAIFLVFVGTLAQVDHDVWFVVEQSYFRVWFAWVELQALQRLVELFTKGEPQPVSGGFWFPGGLLIGSAMFANLMAAHAVRFKVAAKGRRLSAGLAVLAAGAAATLWVIVEGMDQSLKGQLSPAFCDGLWQAIRAALAGGSLWALWLCVQRRDRLRAPEWWLATGVSAVMVGLAGYLYANPGVGPDDAGMRIVWQLTKCGAAAVLTFAGCWMVFRQRAGIVLLHTGIALLMVGELVTHLSAVEGVMTVPEGATVNFAEDIRRVELAVVTDEGDAERVTVVPGSRLAAAAESGAVISHADLPFDLRVARFDVNSTLLPAEQAEDNPATQGAGLERVALPQRSVDGVSTGGGVNRPSAYVELLEKDSGDSLGVWLVSASTWQAGPMVQRGLTPQPVDVGGQPRQIDLRFKRLYKDYAITLEDFTFDRYAGTSIPKNFQSDVVLSDPSRGVRRPVSIWMNNPLRYAGDTLYQSSYDEATEATTVLQVVTNSGWMIPYVSCVFVGFGLVAHFAITLGRFVRRRQDEAARDAAQPAQPQASAEWLSVSNLRRPAVWAPALAALVAAGYFASKARAPGDAADAVSRFAAAPVAEGGRVKPIDTLARTTLQALSGLQEVKPAGEDAEPTPAAEWLLDSVSQRDGWDAHRVFRIENVELLDLLGLPPRPGSYRYSYQEVMAEGERLGQQVDTAVAQARAIEAAGERGESAEPLGIVQEKTLQLADKLTLFHKVVGAFGEPRFSSRTEEGLREELLQATAQVDRLRRTGAPAVAPPSEVGGAWRTLFEASLNDLARVIQGKDRSPIVAAWSGALAAYAGGDDAALAESLDEIERAASDHERALAANPEAAAELALSERLSSGKVRFETWLNRFTPFYYCAAMYVVAFVLAAASWLPLGRVAPRCLARSATAVIVVTLVVHTLALAARVYISGRPPVTNLYSSAVFIGWAVVLLGVAYEAVYRLGIGSAVASALGFATLIVAHYLSLDSDTFTVLQAVLDTQFWLATHVVTVTLGYAATYLAGAFGVAYLFAAALPKALGFAGAVDARGARQVSGMIYGVLCFALLFSFVGTVLGGLWADDSWGRFWGWDPKENGALIIVLWNALVLHARWGKMVGPTGLATLAVGGNIVTTWSWFGVNELGVGLHAYGASESSTALWLLGFAASQAVLILLGATASAAAATRSA
ncbi:cytochrome c biogenesis protein CcsA [Botrimarina sp.]|uniref:cytochrome c biogenesis protein n=1 Tax=Botrimarina sp. TaxID=2795802 RepID=UPI0032EB757C